MIQPIRSYFAFRSRETCGSSGDRTIYKIEPVYDKNTEKRLRDEGSDDFTQNNKTKFKQL